MVCFLLFAQTDRMGSKSPLTRLASPRHRATSIRLCFSSYSFSQRLISRRHARASSPSTYLSASSPLKPPNYNTGIRFERGLQHWIRKRGGGGPYRSDKTVDMSADIRVHHLNLWDRQHWFFDLHPGGLCAPGSSSYGSPRRHALLGIWRAPPGAPTRQ